MIWVFAWPQGEPLRVAEDLLLEIGTLAEEVLATALVDAIVGEDKEVRWGAAFFVPRLGGSAVEPLVAALGHNDPDVRAAELHAIGKIGGAEAVAALVAALQDEDPQACCGPAPTADSPTTGSRIVPRT